MQVVDQRDNAVVVFMLRVVEKADLNRDMHEVGQDEL